MTRANGFRGDFVPGDDVIANCMHCGLCLPTCPTYALTGLERSSPRGRIRLIKAVADGELPITRAFVAEMNFCLDCQACETACPAGVKYGSLVEMARAQAFEQGIESAPSRLIKKILLRWLFMRQSRLKFAARFLRLYQVSGLQRALDRSGLLRLFSRKLADIQPLAPRISPVFTTDRSVEIRTPDGPIRRRVGFLTGCLMDVAFADVNEDTIQLLLAHGCEVILPRGQNCCGSLQAHNGDMTAATEMAKRNIAVFAPLDVEAFVMNSAGCGAFMKEYGHVFANDPDLRDRAASVSAKTLDITEYLLKIGYKPGSRYAGKVVTYHDACHLVHTQKIAHQPRALIRSIPGITFVEMGESTWCCGSAGIYNIVHDRDAALLLERKVDHIAAAKADIIVTGNPGCLLQIGHGLRTRGVTIELLHTATFLRRGCES